MNNITIVKKHLPIIQDETTLSGHALENTHQIRFNFQTPKVNIIFDETGIPYGTPLSCRGYRRPVQDTYSLTQDTRCLLGEKGYPVGNTK